MVEVNEEYEAVSAAIVQALSSVTVVDFDAVRKASGKTVKEWPDGYIHQVAIGLKKPVKRAFA